MNKHRISTIILAVLILSGAVGAVVVNIDGSNLTPVSWFNSNKTIWDAKGNASYPVNLSNSSQVTNVLPNASIPLSSLNRSDVNVYSANESNISVAKQGNGSYAVNLVVPITSGGYTGQTFWNGSAACTVNKVYQNLNTTTRTVYIYISSFTAGNLDFNIGTTNPPNQNIYNLGTAGANMMIFIVPSNYYYAFNNMTGGTVRSCFEIN